MKKVFKCIAFLAIVTSLPCANAQEATKITPYQTDKTSKETLIRNYGLEKERVEKEEKEKLKMELERINAQLKKNEISAEEAKTQKEAAAKVAALNIDNKTAILDNQMALLERDENYNYKGGRKSYIALGLGNAYDSSGSALLGIEYVNNKTVRKEDKRTYSDAVIAFGANNVVSNHTKFTNSPYKWWQSGFLEIGYTMRTRLLKESNAVRLAYGLSFQFNHFTPSGNRYFVDNNGQTSLQPFDYDLKISTMRFTNLVLPVYFEFGPSVKKNYGGYYRYSNAANFKIGVGGYAGFNIGNVQRLKYKENGNSHDFKMREDFNAHNTVYGLGMYVGFGAMSIYTKYDLNPLFKNNPEKEHNLSLGMRFDL